MDFKGNEEQERGTIISLFLYLFLKRSFYYEMDIRLVERLSGYTGNAD